SVATIFYWTHGNSQLPKERVEIFGEGKAACFENFERYELWKAGRKIVRRARAIDKGQRDQLTAFVAAMKMGTSMPIGLASLIATTKVTLATQKSAVANAPISID